MGLHLAVLAAAARGHRKRHGNARPQRRLHPIVRNARAELEYKRALLQLVKHLRGLVAKGMDELQPHWPRPTSGDSRIVGDSEPSPEIARVISRIKGQLGGLDTFAKRLTGIAVMRNRESVDKRLAAEIERAIGVNVSALLTANGPLLQSMQKATIDNVALIKSIPEQYLDRVYETVTGAWSQGMRWEAMVEQVQEDGDITENRAKLIARDQTSKMNAAFNQERQQQVGIERYEWSTSQDERVRGDPSGKYPDADPSHWEYAHQDNGWGPGVFSWSDPPEDGHPGEAINCFPGSTILSPSARVLKAYRRAYRGELTTLILANGESVSATPNHPVLTRRGWIPIQLVDVGEDVFEAPRKSGEIFVGNPERVQPTAFEFFRALSLLGIEQRIVDAATGFHGDATDEQVDVVTVDWSLGDKLDATLSKEFCQEILARSDAPALQLGPFSQLFGGAGLATDSIVRGACKLLSGLWADLSHANQHALSAIARLDSLALEVVGDRFALDTKVFRELLHAHTLPEEQGSFLMRILFGVVCRAIDPAHLDSTLSQFDAEVIGVDVQHSGDLAQTHPLLQQPVRVVDKLVSENTSGHVFNLQTTTGWYVAQGLLVHNCRCVAIPVVDMEEVSEAAGESSAEQEQEAA